MTVADPVTLVRRGAIVIAVAAVQLAIAASCAPAANSASGEDSMATGSKTNQQAIEWTPLFDGRTTAGWRGYRAQTVPAGWRAGDGVLTKDGRVGDLITTGQFGDLELAFDWKLSPGGNSGAFVRATEEYDYVFWSAPEYQLLDDARHPDGNDRITSAGSAFGLYPAPAGVVKPADEWNSSLIVARGNHVEHWLNGQKLLEYDLGSSEWEAKVKANKFAPYKNFGRASRGHVAFQGDHEGTLSLRNIRVRELK